MPPNIQTTETISSIISHYASMAAVTLGGILVLHGIATTDTAPQIASYVVGTVLILAVLAFHGLRKLVDAKYPNTPLAKVVDEVDTALSATETQVTTATQVTTTPAAK